MSLRLASAARPRLAAGGCAFGLLGLMQVVVACRAEAPSEPVAATPGVLAPVTVAPPPPVPAAPPIPEDFGPAVTIAGFDLAGPYECQPLASGRRCIQRPDPLAASCAAAGGRTEACVDCRLICTVAPKAQRR